MTKNVSIVYRSKDARLAIIDVNRLDLTEAIMMELDDQRASGEHEFDNYYLALLNVEEFAENQNRKQLLNAARRALISIGCYREVTPEEIAKMTCKRFPKFDFVLDRKRYRWTS